MDVIGDISEVTPSLYVSAGSVITDQKLRDLGITLVINSTQELNNYRPPKESSIEVIKVPVKDLSDTDLGCYFKATANLIRANEECGGKTLVHCIFGVSRSVTLCMAYLMMYKTSNKVKTPNDKGSDTMDVYESLDYIRSKRSIARPNPGFMRQLVRFQEQITEAGDDDTKHEVSESLCGSQNQVIQSIKQLTHSFQSSDKENTSA